MFRKSTFHFLIWFYLRKINFVNSVPASTSLTYERSSRTASSTKLLESLRPPSPWSMWEMFRQGNPSQNDWMISFGFISTSFWTIFGLFHHLFGDKVGNPKETSNGSSQQQPHFPVEKWFGQVGMDPQNLRKHNFIACSRFFAASHLLLGVLKGSTVLNHKLCHGCLNTRATI